MPVIGYCRNLHSNLCPCFVCSKKFSLDNGVEDLLTHICFTHRVVIENIDRIADFKKYMEYYVNRYREAPLESFTKQFTIEITEGDSEPREQKYYLLGDSSPEDENLRKNLHAKRLKAAQKQQKIDLGSYYFMRHCFYCHQTLEVTNAQFVNHLRNHGFQLGHPDKLVYIGKFIEAIEDTFRNFHCLYCEMEFESCRALIHHMEKKGHLKIHANNRFYDQFYIINYLEFGKTWLDFVKDKNKSCPEQQVVVSSDDTEWSTWGIEPENIVCLFCPHICRSWEGTLLHLQVSHDFDFKSKMSHLNFYQQVKIVNYIRFRIMNALCINCDFHSENENDLMNHMEVTNHFAIPSNTLWDHEKYFFCTLENDMFLCHLEDDNIENDCEMKETVDPLTKPEIRLENGNDSSSSSEGMMLEYPDTIASVDELVKRNSAEGDYVPIEKLTIEDEKVCPKDIELCSSAHMGAGDSAQKMTDDQQTVKIKKMNFGDA